MCTLSAILCFIDSTKDLAGCLQRIFPSFVAARPAVAAVTDSDDHFPEERPAAIEIEGFELCDSSGDYADVG